MPSSLTRPPFQSVVLSFFQLKNHQGAPFTLPNQAQSECEPSGPKLAWTADVVALSLLLPKWRHVSIRDTFFMCSSHPIFTHSIKRAWKCNKKVSFFWNAVAPPLLWTNLTRSQCCVCSEFCHLPSQLACSYFPPSSSSAQAHVCSHCKRQMSAFHVFFSVFWFISVAAPPTGRVHVQIQALDVFISWFLGLCSASVRPLYRFHQPWRSVTISFALSRHPSSGEEELGPPYVTGNNWLLVKEVAVA